MRIRLLLMTLIISSTALFAACAPTGGASKASDPAAEPGTYDMKVPTEEANAIVSQTELFCDGPCPPALAISLARVDQNRATLLQQCTAFLVAEDVVATNAHCVPEEIHVAQADCAGRMTFYFGSPSEAVTCEQILSVSQESKTNLKSDIAFIRLSRAVKRAPLKLSRMGLTNEAAHTVLSIDPVVINKRHVGRLRRQTCVPKQGSMLTPQFTNDFADVGTMACEMKLGNSGSPVLAADGSVRGLLHGFRTGTSKSYKGIKLPEKFSALSFVSNVACSYAPSPLLESDPPSACFADPVKREDVIKKLEAATPSDFDTPFAEWVRTSAPRMFEFTLEDISANGHKAAVAKFKCVKPLDSWISEASVSGSKATLKMTVPLWGLQPSMDEAERVSMAVAEIDHAKTTMTFDPVAARRNGFIRFAKTFTSETGRLVVRETTFDLPYCN